MTDETVGVSESTDAGRRGGGPRHAKLHGPSSLRLARTDGTPPRQYHGAGNQRQGHALHTSAYVTLLVHKNPAYNCRRRFYLTRRKRSEEVEMGLRANRSVVGVVILSTEAERAHTAR